MTNAWELLADCDPVVRRMLVPGGWLYQVEHHQTMHPISAEPGHYVLGWHAPVFVPDAGKAVTR